MKSTKIEFAILSDYEDSFTNTLITPRQLFAAAEIAENITADDYGRNYDGADFYFTYSKLCDCVMIMTVYADDDASAPRALIDGEYTPDRLREIAREINGGYTE